MSRTGTHAQALRVMLAYVVDHNRVMREDVSTVLRRQPIYFYEGGTAAVGAAMLLSQESGQRLKLPKKRALTPGELLDLDRLIGWEITQLQALRNLILIERDHLRLEEHNANNP